MYVLGCLLRWMDEKFAEESRRNQHSQECKDQRRQCFCDLLPRTFTPKQTDFQESSCNISMSSLVIPATTVF